MLVLGIDPDTNTSGFCLVEEKDGKIRVLECGIADTRGTTGILGVERSIIELFKILPTLPTADAVIAEYPEHYNRGAGRPKKNVNPNNLIMLAAVSGSALSAANVKEGGVRELVRPKIWKGQQSKGANHRQTCRVLGWTWGGSSSKYSMALTEVSPLEDVKVHGWKGKSGKPWSEILDATGIAIYGLSKYGGHL